jgi:hypothetical protein
MVRSEDSGLVEDVIVNDGTRLRIRRALTGDDGVLGDLNAFVHQPHVAALPDEYRPYASDAAAQYFAGVIEGDSHPIWIAEVGKSPVAYLEAEVRSRPDNPFTTELRVLYVHQLAVAEHARRLGGEVADACRGKHGPHVGVHRGPPGPQKLQRGSASFLQGTRLLHVFGEHGKASWGRLERSVTP